MTPEISAARDDLRAPRRTATQRNDLNKETTCEL